MRIVAFHIICGDAVSKIEIYHKRESIPSASKPQEVDGGMENLSVNTTCFCSATVQKVHLFDPRLKKNVRKCSTETLMFSNLSPVKVRHFNADWAPGLETERGRGGMCSKICLRIRIGSTAAPRVVKGGLRMGRGAAAAEGRRTKAEKKNNVAGFLVLDYLCFIG